MIKVSDIEVSASHYDMRRHLLTGLGQLTTSDVLDVTKVRARFEDVSTEEEAAASAKFTIRSYRWIQAFYLHGPKHALDDKWDKVFTHAGISHKFDDHELSYLFAVKRKAWSRELSEFISDNDPMSSDTQYAFIISHEKLRSEYIGDPSIGILERASWLAKRHQLARLIDNMRLADYFQQSSHRLEPMVQVSRPTLERLNELRTVFESAVTHKTDARTLYSLRNDLLTEQGHRQRTIDNERDIQASTKFNRYWQSLKTRDEISPELQRFQFMQIPLLPTGTSASRTWGIEIETVRADQTERPRGWESKYDGSLPDSDGCNCDCDYCYNGDHDDCGDCASDSREFVSPILNSYNSKGLARLCSDLGTSEDDSEYCGIHVHVGAEDLSVQDITRLLLSYSIIEPLFDPLYHRQDRNYCKTMPTDQLRWWLAKVREFSKTSSRGHQTPKNILYGTNQAAPDRYVDLNVQSLSNHGTVEFRAMGAWYDYDHLVRWAWIARELVNVSKLGIDQREWVACHSMVDVIALLRKYGTEMPDEQLFAEKSLNAFEMADSEV